MDTNSAAATIEPASVITDAANKTIENGSIEKHTNKVKFRMIALDLDGTLLHSNRCMSEATADYLKGLHKRGIVVILASGRAQQTMYEHVQRLGPLMHPDFGGMPIVCSNGAKGLICRPSSPENEKLIVKELFYTPVPHNITVRAVDLANRLGFISQFYSGEAIYANPSADLHYELAEAYKKLTGSNTIYVKDHFKDLLSSNALPSKLIVMFHKDEQDRAMEAYEKEFGDEATIVRGSYGWFLEILHKDVCKGHGLQLMCDKLKIPIEECVAFGDGDNDIEFLQMSGRGVAMKNARECVKEIADAIAEHTNNEDGVILELQQMEKDGYLAVE